MTVEGVGAGVIVVAMFVIGLGGPVVGTAATLAIGALLLLAGLLTFALSPEPPGRGRTRR